MDPMFQAAIGSVVRWVLALGAGYLVKAGIWTGSDAETYAAGGALALVALGWSMWQKYQSRLKFVTALTMPAGATEATVEAHIASGEPLPSVSTPATVVPKAVPLLLLALCLSGVAVTSCAPKTYTTDAGRAAYRAEQVNLRLGEFQRVVIDASHANKVKLADARAIVSWISGDSSTTPPMLGAIDVIQRAPSGWRETVRQSWAVLRPRVVAADAIIAGWVPTIDTLLEGL